MKALAITHKGLEKYCELEIKEYLSSTTTTTKIGAVVFTFETWEQLFLLCYKLQSPIRILYLLDEGTSTYDEIPEKAKSISWDQEFLNQENTFVVHTLRAGSHISSNDLAAEIGGIIIDKTKATVNIKNPEIPIITYVADKEYSIGVDVVGFNLSKRQHILFAQSVSFKGTLGFGLLKIAGYDKTKAKETLLVDPFCSAGEIVIEAALYASGFPVHFFNKEKFAFTHMKKFKEINFDDLFDKVDEQITKTKFPIQGYDKQLRHVSAAEKNAKIADINKMLKISRADLHWLDVKKDKETVDFLVSYVPSLRKEQEKERNKMYQQLFYQLEFVMKQDGTVVIATMYPDLAKKYSQEYKFVVDEELVVWQGKKELSVLRLKKGKA